MLKKKNIDCCFNSRSCYSVKQHSCTKTTTTTTKNKMKTNKKTNKQTNNTKRSTLAIVSVSYLGFHRGRHCVCPGGFPTAVLGRLFTPGVGNLVGFIGDLGAGVLFVGVGEDGLHLLSLVQLQQVVHVQHHGGQGVDKVRGLFRVGLQIIQLTPVTVNIMSDIP